MKQTLIAIDQFINTCIWIKRDGFGWADETLSARAHRLASDGNKMAIIVERVINTLFLWQTEHCFQSYMSERDRLQLPPEYRK